MNQVVGTKDEQNKRRGEDLDKRSGQRERRMNERKMEE